MLFRSYLKKHPESLADLPPLIVLNGRFEDGAHRLSAIWLLQQRMDTKNPLWANAKLNVQFVEQGLTEEKQQINWIKPNFDYEWDEIEFQANEPNVPADIRAYMNQHFPDKEAWLQAVQHGRPVTVSPDHKYKINNYPDKIGRAHV